MKKPFPEEKRSPHAERDARKRGKLRWGDPSHVFLSHPGSIAPPQIPSSRARSVVCADTIRKRERRRWCMIGQSFT